MIDSFYPFFNLDTLNKFVAGAVILFGLITLIYSLGFMKGQKRLGQYYGYLILTVIVSAAAVLANNLILLLVLWGFLGFTLYILINVSEDKNAAPTAKKTFIIVGGSDALMLLAVGIIYHLTGTWQMDKIKLELNSTLPIVAYLFLAVACFAKAGVMPFHSWIPDCAQSAPVPVVAFLPASLDKLLGIYLLARISLNLFVMTNAMNIFLMCIGAFTIIAAVMMALIQHDLKRLLGYHAVSQVGYMVLGIGTGNPVGIAGGLFHMLNNAIYKSCLFLTGGNVQQRTKTTDLDKLGGLAKFMPITFIGCLIASLSISGVPPFNGFVSKWMIYQGLITAFSVPAYRQAGSASAFSLLFLAIAMFGSALTLASFMKLIHATFLGMAREEKQKIKEVSWLLWLPVLVLATLCVVFGVFAQQLPLKYFILPAVKEVNIIGFWSSGLATALILLGIILGSIIYFLGTIKTSRADSFYVGGEEFSSEERITGTDFYNTIKDIPLFNFIYKKAEDKFFDIYEQGKKIVFTITEKFQYLHNGILPTYLVWCLLGMLALFLYCLGV